MGSFLQPVLGTDSRWEEARNPREIQEKHESSEGCHQEEEKLCFRPGEKET